MKNKYIAIGYQYQRPVAMIAVMVIICTIAFGMLVPFMTANAETTYTDVLEDLSKETSFDKTQWEARDGDYSLSLITIAEGATGELFVYVYQPAGSKNAYYASDIRISETIDDSIAPRDYPLVYLNHSGVFYKYRVDGITVKKDAVRYYAVIQLMRCFMEGIDTQADYDNTIDAVPFDVSRQFKFSTINGNDSLTDIAIDTVTITSKFVGFVRYVANKSWIGNKPYNGTDRFFVAFSTDHDIDELIEIELTYVKQNVTGYASSKFGQLWEYFDERYEKVPVHKVITNEDYYDYHFRFLWQSVDHHWDLIQDVDTFMDTATQTSKVYRGIFFDVNNVTGLNEIGRDALADKQWVVSFDEATFVTEAGADPMPPFYMCVGEVTILRLKFLTNGYQYNLGVVDNKQTGSSKPVSETHTEVVPSESTPSWLKMVVAIILLVVLLIVLWPIVPYIAKFLFWLVSFPFKAAKSVSEARNTDEAKARRAEKKRVKQEQKAQRRADKVKEQLKSGKKNWADLTEAEEQAVLNDDEYINSMFDDDSWNGED